jgi:hypothetical protein
MAIRDSVFGGIVAMTDPDEIEHARTMYRAVRRVLMSPEKRSAMSAEGRDLDAAMMKFERAFKVLDAAEDAKLNAMADKQGALIELREVMNRLRKYGKPPAGQEG